MTIGASSLDLRLCKEIERKGTTDACPYDKAKLPSYYTGNVSDVGDGEFETLLGRALPDAGYKFYKKNRMTIDENCTVADLRYSKRWIGRLFSWGVRFAHKFLWGIGKRSNANTIMMGVYHQPVRGLAKFGGMSRRQMEGMLMMFNGHFFKGAGRFFSKEKTKKSATQKKEAING